jgi:hypothetical protein
MIGVRPMESWSPRRWKLPGARAPEIHCGPDEAREARVDVADVGGLDALSVAGVSEEDLTTVVGSALGRSGLSLLGFRVQSINSPGSNITTRHGNSWTSLQHYARNYPACSTSFASMIR